MSIKWSSFLKQWQIDDSYLRSIQSYLDWQANPVLTTVNTTAYPVKMIEFPAVTICGQGMSDDVISAAMFKQFFQFVAQKNLTNTINPLRAQELIYIKG